MDQPSSASVTPSEDTTSLSSSEYSLALTSPDSERSESVPRSEYFLASQDTPEPSLPSTESSIYPSTESEFGITSPSIVSEIDVPTSSIISELDQSSMSHDLELQGPPVLSSFRDLALQEPSRPPGAELPRPLGRQPTSSQARPLIIPVADDCTSDSDHRTSSVSLSIFDRETSSGSACSGRRRYSSESPPRPDIGLLTELPELEDIPASEDIPAPVGPVGLAVVTVPRDSPSDSDHITSSVSLSIFNRETSSGSACSGRRRYSSESPHRPDIGLLTELPELVEDIPASEDIPAPVGPVGLAVNPTAASSAANIQSDSDEVPTSSIARPLMSPKKGSPVVGHVKEKPDMPLNPASSDAEVSIKILPLLQVEFKRPLNPGSIHPPIEIPPADPIVPAISPVSPDDNPVQPPVDNTNAPPPAEQPAPVDPVTAGNNTSSRDSTPDVQTNCLACLQRLCKCKK